MVVSVNNLQKHYGKVHALDGVSLQRLGQLLLAWGAAWWALALASEVMRFVTVDRQASVLLVVAALSALIWMLLALRTRWSELATLCSLLAPVAGLILIHAWHSFYHPAAHFGAKSVQIAHVSGSSS